MKFVQIAVFVIDGESFLYALENDGAIYEMSNKYYPVGTEFNGQYSKRGCYGASYWRRVELPFEEQLPSESQIKRACI